MDSHLDLDDDDFPENYYLQLLVLDKYFELLHTFRKELKPQYQQRKKKNEVDREQKQRKTRNHVETESIPLIICFCFVFTMWSLPLLCSYTLFKVKKRETILGEVQVRNSNNE